MRIELTSLALELSQLTDIISANPKSRKRENEG
jgi:hypothetical protein